ncbi:MAG: DUF475 domain-containing protein [Pseudomonadota bacterium]|nr:DUF475 domain-containing protein [Pseudomonadota bacterium]
MMKFFKGSFLFTLVGLVLGAVIGWRASGSVEGALSALFIVAVLGVLEVSLSFDNAVVNATVLKDMDAIWRRRFLTWGIAIAVFGMRIVFPLVIVAIVAWISPWEAVMLAITDPTEYGVILTKAHISVSAFGGAFLMMVGLKHFLDVEKDVFWIRIIEQPISRLGRIEALQLAIVMILLYAVSTQVAAAEQVEFLVAGIFGLVTYIAVDGVGALMQDGGAGHGEAVVRTGLGAFLYLEVLDASFSFDGVIGAFALTTNLLIIAIGLGIGAMFVRSLTIMLVEKGTLAEYRYLEHGAFYAIVALGVIMFLQAFLHIPELVTGLIGATFIGVALISSVRYNRAHPAEAEAAAEAAQ